MPIKEARSQLSPATYSAKPKNRLELGRHNNLGVDDIHVAGGTECRRAQIAVNKRTIAEASHASMSFETRTTLTVAHKTPCLTPKRSARTKIYCGRAPSRAPFHVPATAAERRVTSVSTTTSATATIGLPGQHCKHRKPFKCTACFSRQTQRPVFRFPNSLSLETHLSFAMRREANLVPER